MYFLCMTGITFVGNFNSGNCFMRQELRKGLAEMNSFLQAQALRGSVIQQGDGPNVCQRHEPLRE